VSDADASNCGHRAEPVPMSQRRKAAVATTVAPSTDSSSLSRAGGRAQRSHGDKMVAGIRRVWSSGSALSSTLVNASSGFLSPPRRRFVRHSTWQRTLATCYADVRKAASCDATGPISTFAPLAGRFRCSRRPRRRFMYWSARPHNGGRSTRHGVDIIIAYQRSLGRFLANQ
jgi:hypothetical protein